MDESNQRRSIKKNDNKDLISEKIQLKNQMLEHERESLIEVSQENIILEKDNDEELGNLGKHSNAKRKLLPENIPVGDE